jgi:hypothetical protein
MSQIKNSFDSETIKKILRGAWIAALAPALIGLLYFYQASIAQNVDLNAFAVLAIPSLVYLINQWKEKKITLLKVGISLGLSAVGSLIIFFGQQDLGKYAYLFAWIAPTALNAIKEYLSGICGECSVPSSGEDFKI